MAPLRLLYFSVLLWMVAKISGQGVFLERPENQRVELNTSARLNCTANDTTLASVQWRRGDSAVTLSEGVSIERGSLLLAAVTWSDIGEYTCIITFSGAEYSASAVLNITGYVKPFVDGVEGVSTFNHVVGEEKTIECPVSGNPGPETWYWQYPDSGENVTSDGSVENGVFVDSRGQLDVSGVESANSTLFACVGVDAAGNSARARIRVVSVEPEEAERDDGVDLLRWYFIVAYSVGGVLVLFGVAVVLFVCWLHHDQCCQKVAQRKPTRVRVRRSKVKLDDIEMNAYR